MDHAEPKTRKEKKGRDREHGGDPYSQKRVRQVEAMMEKRAATKAPAAKKGK
jgi:hypothetical protein